MSETIPEEGTQTLHIRYENGTVGVVSVGDGVTTEIESDAVVITQAEYETQAAALRKAHEQRAEEMRDAEEEAVSADYQALRAAGVAEATARRLTGYTG